MKRLLVLFILISSLASAQTPTGFTNVFQRYVWLGGKFNERLGVPVTDTLTDPLFVGEVRIRTADNGFYYCVSLTGQKWIKAGGTAGISSVNATASGALGFSGGPITTSGTLALNWQGLASQYVKGNGATGNFFDDVTAINDSRYALNPHAHVSSDITDLTTTVRNLFSGGSGITYNASTGVISWPGTGVITSLNGLSGADQTLVPSGNISISSVGTAHTFTVPFGVDSLKQSNDSVYGKVNGEWRFQYVQSGGGDTSSLSNRINQKQSYGDTLTYDASKWYVDGVKSAIAAQLDDSTNALRTDLVPRTELQDTASAIRAAGGASNLLVQPVGTGQQITYDSGDTLYTKKITGDGNVSVSTSSDSTIHVAVNLSSYPNRTELGDTAAAIRADMGTGSGITKSGTYGPGGGALIWIDTTINRIAYQVGNTIFHGPITDSIDGATYDTDAQSYIDRVNATDVTLTTPQKQAINDYVSGLKTDTLWTKIYDQGLPVWGTASSSAIMLKGTHTTTWVNSPTFSSSGVTGNGTSSYGNLGFSPATAYSSQDNAHVAVYIHDNQTNVNYADIGTLSTSPTRAVRINSKANSATQTFLNGSTDGAVNVPSSAGFTLLNRTTSTNLQTYKNGTLLSNGANTSTGLATNNTYILASNQDGTPGVYSARTLSLWSMGATLTATQVTKLSTRVNTLMTALGINVY